MIHKCPRWLTLGFLALSLFLLSFGIFRGEMGVVLTKATNICLECIGIG